MSSKGGPVFTFSLPGGATRPLAPRQLRHWLLDAFCKNTGHFLNSGRRRLCCNS